MLQRNNAISNDRMPARCNSKMTKLSGSSVENCYKLLGAQQLTRIKNPLDELYKNINDDPKYSSELKDYLFNTLQQLARQLEIINYVNYEQSNYNYELAYTYNQKKYGDINITDSRKCPIQTQKSSECIQPCAYDKKTKGCKITY